MEKCLTSYTFGIKGRGHLPSETQNRNEAISCIFLHRALPSSPVFESATLHRLGTRLNTARVVSTLVVAAVRSLRWIDNMGRVVWDVRLSTFDMDSGKVVIFETRSITVGIVRSIGTQYCKVSYSLSITSAHRSLFLITVFLVFLI